ncbi:MAG: hypothetical protein HRT88_22280, partial [Lentisphaeraceae bacterium]|nr:hypothetical protein [Lentisphaeraceae bacterium]
MEKKLPKNLNVYCKTIEFKIPKIGSFGDSFDPNCEKVKNFSAMLARRLTLQQGPDGSWPFDVGAYVSPVFYTSMCGLGLLSTADPSYEKHIKKAAYYVAYSGKCSGWSYARGLAAWFLGEYYLRTKDKAILPGLATALKRAESNLAVGSIAGHNVNPGYGGSGWIGGSGVIACAFAIAEHIPVKFNRGTAARMLKYVQSVAIQGSTPYGRGGGKRPFGLNDFIRGQGSCAGTGPYFLAAKINGGSKHFHDAATRRFTTAPYGNVDAGHATHTLPFIFGSLAISLCGEQYHAANMEAFLRKLTTHRGFDGLIVNNANPLEFHTGENVMGKPWFSTGAWLLLLNAHKQNLASTGKKQFRAKSHKKLIQVSNPEIKVWRQTLRQWSVVEAVLGRKAPSALKIAVKKLRAFEKDETLGENIFKWMKKNAIPVARRISALTLKSKLLKNYCIEIILGVNHDIYLDEQYWDQGDKGSEKRENLKKEHGDMLVLDLKSSTFFGKCNSALYPESRKINSLSMLDFKGVLIIKDARGRLVKGLPPKIDLSASKLDQKFTLPALANTEKLYAHFSYNCGGLKVKYKRELIINRDKNLFSHNENLRKLWAPGTLVKSFDTWNIHFRLPNKSIYH